MVKAVDTLESSLEQIMYNEVTTTAIAPINVSHWYKSLQLKPWTNSMPQPTG